MNATPGRRTIDLIDQARHTIELSRQKRAELERVHAEVNETLRFFQWWRFLDYDPDAEAFIETLDLRNSRERTES